MQKNFLAFVGSESEFNFYVRLRNGLQVKGFRLILFTHRPSLLLQSKLHRIPCALVRNEEKGNADLSINSTVELLANKVNQRDASRYFHGVLQTLAHLHQVEGISVLFIWNGHTLPAKAMSVFAQKNDIPTLFAEHTNLPNKLFIDPRGVFAQSLLFHKRELLQRYAVDDAQFAQWRDRYLHDRRIEKNIADDTLNHGKAGIASVLDLAASWFIDIPIIREHTGSEELNSIQKISYDHYNVNEGTYNFFPMQLSVESSLLFDNSVSAFDAVGIAYERSREQKRDLVITLHPQERKKEIIEFISTVQKEEGAYLVDQPIFQLVEHCQEIITVNSHTGLDGMLAGKKVTFLGASCFSHMDEKQMKAYILGYLIDIDYLGKEEIPVKTVETILSRLLLQ